MNKPKKLLAAITCTYLLILLAPYEVLGESKVVGIIISDDTDDEILKIFQNSTGVPFPNIDFLSVDPTIITVPISNQTPTGKVLQPGILPPTKPTGTGIIPIEWIAETNPNSESGNCSPDDLIKLLTQPLEGKIIQPGSIVPTEPEGTGIIPIDWIARAYPCPMDDCGTSGGSGTTQGGGSTAPPNPGPVPRPAPSTK